MAKFDFSRATRAKGPLGEVTRIKGGGGEWVAGEAPPDGPYVDPLTARTIVLIGASLFAQGTGTIERRTWLQSAARAMGYRGAVVSEAEGGDGISDTLAKLPGIADKYRVHAAETAYLMHRFGNNVTAARPWTPQQNADWLNGLRTIRDTFEAEGSGCIFGNVSYRTYQTSPPVEPHLDEADLNGAGPYNLNIVEPFIRAENRRWWDAVAGRAVVDNYAFVRERLGWLSDDAIHGEPGIQDVFVERALWAIASAVRPTVEDAEPLAGRSILISPAFDPDHRSRAGGITPVAHFTGVVVDREGFPLPGVSVDFVGWSPVEQLGPTDAAWQARVPDTRFHGGPAHIARAALYASAPAQLTRRRHPAGHVVIRGLDAGATGTVTLIGMRAGAVGDGTRLAVTIDGFSDTVVLNSAEDAGSNQIVLPFTVPADGRLTLSCAPAAGAEFGQLNAMIVDFAAGPAAPPAIAPPVVAGKSSVRSDAATASVTIAPPAGTQAGELLMMVVATGTAEITVTPDQAGWAEVTQLPRSQGFTSGLALLWRVAAADDPPSWSVTFESAVRHVSTILRLTGAEGDEPAAVSPPRFGDPAATAHAPSVTATGPDQLLINVLVTASGQRSFTVPLGMEIAHQDANNNGGSDRVSLLIATQAHGAAERTGGRALGLSSASSWAALSLTVSPG